MFDSWAEIDLYKMKQDGIYGNELNDFLLNVGEFEKDWTVSPLVAINHKAPFKIYFNTSDMLMAFYLVFSEYVIDKGE